MQTSTHLATDVHLETRLCLCLSSPFDFEPAYPNARTRPRADTAAPASFRTRGSVLGRAHTDPSGPKSRFAGGRAGEPRRGGPDAIRRPGVPAGRREPEDPRAARRTADGGSPGSAPAAKRDLDDINSACPRALAPTRHASTPRSAATRPGFPRAPPWTFGREPTIAGRSRLGDILPVGRGRAGREDTSSPRVVPLPARAAARAVPSATADPVADAPFPPPNAPFARARPQWRPR